MIQFTHTVQITKDFAIELDVEASVDPGEPESWDCPGSVGGIDAITVTYKGVRCENDLDEGIMDAISEKAEELYEDPPFDPPDREDD